MWLHFHHAGGFTGVRTYVAAVEQAVAQDATKLDAPVVIVTGASRGIGKATALALGKAGCKVSSFKKSSYKFYQLCMVLILYFTEIHCQLF